MSHLILVTLTATGLYALACWIIPFGRCRVCSGTSIRRTIITHRYRPCRWCRGSGRRLRAGRRAFNYLTRVHRDATTRRRSAGGVR